MHMLTTAPPPPPLGAPCVGSLKTDNAQGCCDACYNISDCKVGVFQLSSKTCFWKGGIVHRVPKPGSGLVACTARTPPPPPPPYDCSAAGANCAGRIGATHWNPCYFINETRPCLLDGADVLASTGSRVIKVAVFSPRSNYPFNSPLWPADDAFDTLLNMVSHPYYRELWASPRFDTYVLVAYSTVGGAAGGDISYWTKGITDKQVAEETEQLKAATSFLHVNFPDKTFVVENWEGDWASRAGGYDPKKPASDLALMSMRKWLAARQAGVTAARQEAQRVLGAAPSGHLYFAAEVNLVQESRVAGAANMINRVIPFVQLDMVSYSSYDTETSPENFRAALQYLQRQHNRTAAAPPGPRAIFVAE